MKNLKRLVSIMLIFAALCMLFPVCAFASSTHYMDSHCLCADGNCTCGGATITWQPWSKTTSLPSSGNYYLTADVTLKSTWTPTGTVRLCLNTHNVYYEGSSGSLLRIKNGVTVNITDCQGPYTSNQAGQMHSGYGTKKGDETVGGSVYIEKGTLNLYGGTICLGTAKRGGLVYVSSNGTFNFYDGHLDSGNLNTSSGTMYGGDVYVDGGVFRMSGGQLQNGEATYGAGVYVTNGGRCDFSTGTGAGSTGITGGCYAFEGGAIWIGSGCTVNITGDFEISGCEVEKYGKAGGIYCQGTLNISGSPHIYQNGVGGDGIYRGTPSNVYLANSSAKINIVGEMSEKTIIGVTPYNYTADFTTGWSDYMSGVTKYSDFFCADSKQYEIVLNENGTELTFGTGHNYLFTISGGNQINVNCTGCVAITGWKIQAPAAGSVEATLTQIRSASGMNLSMESPEIYYKGIGDTVYESSVIPPFKKGIYAAYITLGGVTASIEYELTCDHTNLTLIPEVEASCVTDGSNAYYSCGCGLYFAEDGETLTTVEEETIPAIGHSFTDYVPDGNATCVEDGTKTAVCDRCDERDTIADVDSALGHNMVTDEGYPATCTEPGMTDGAHCTRCDEATVAQEELPAMGHEFDRGYCTVCGERDSDCPPGDINGDGAVNNKDLTRLFQYLSDWDVEVVEAALDINGDGSVNNKDLTRLFQYLSDWDVEIY